MARVEITVVDEQVDNDRGGKGPGVRATCDECGESVTCPNSDDNNFYVDPDIEDRDP